jgi:hypothetical protein
MTWLHPLRRAARRVDSRRWAGVESLIEADEVQVDSAPGRVLRGAYEADGLVGYVLLSDRALYLHVPSDVRGTLPTPGRSFRMPLASIAHVRSDLWRVMHLEWADGEGETTEMSFDFFEFSGVGPLAVGFYKQLLSAVNGSHRS